MVSDRGTNVAEDEFEWPSKKEGKRGKNLPTVGDPKSMQVGSKGTMWQVDERFSFQHSEIAVLINLARTGGKRVKYMYCKFATQYLEYPRK